MTEDMVEDTLSGLFVENSGWTWAPIETCKRLKLFPNRLAFHETTATLALIVKRSMSGDDFALSEAGLSYLLAALKNGARKDGKALRHALVVLAEVDVDQQVQRRPHPYKVISHSTAQAIRDRFNGITPNPGFNGPYWWLSPEMVLNDDDAWSIDFKAA